MTDRAERVVEALVGCGAAIGEIQNRVTRWGASEKKKAGLFAETGLKQKDPLRLDCCVAALVSANSQHIFKGKNENLPVANLARLGGF